MNSELRRVFVPYQRGLATGGPEAAHQLVDALRNFGLESFLVPVEASGRSGRVSHFSHYDAPEERAWSDDDSSMIVAPEALVRYLTSVRKARRACWWLSVDNSEYFRHERAIFNRRLLGERSVGLEASSSLKEASHVMKRLVRGRTRLLGALEHLAQSEYAAAYLFLQRHIQSDMLSDYVVADAVEVSNISRLGGKPRVGYNPKKGARFLWQLRDAIPDVEWVPLTGMTRSQLSDTLGTLSVYVDLGHSPGKDRMPRESAISGAVSLVARLGSGAFASDTPLPSSHRVVANRSLVPNFERALREILRDPQLAWDAQAPYRLWVRDEKSRFLSEVKSTFLRPAI